MNLKTILPAGALAALAIQSASAQISLYTTTNDFMQFSGGGATAATGYYSDGSSLNGAANYANGGGSGSAGSLQLTSPGGWSQSVTWEPNAAWDQGLLSALDPGAVAGASLTAYSGVLSFDAYRGNFTDWNDFGIGFNYNGFWGAYWPSTRTDFTGADGRTWTHYEVPYSINATAGLTYFNVGISQNAGATSGNIFYVDNLQVVPEPSAFALAGFGMAALLASRRRR